MKNSFCVIGMLVVLMCAGLIGCASEPERKWFTAETGPDPAQVDRLRPFVGMADQRAAAYLAQKGYQEPVRALEGYDRAFLEETREDGRKEFTVLYTQRKIDPSVNAEAARFRVVVDEENKKAMLVER